MRHIIPRCAVIGTAIALVIAGIPAAALASPRHMKQLDTDGSIPRRWDIKTPVIPSDDTTPTSAGGSGDGANDISFTYFEDGDMVCVFPGGTLAGHAGIWKDALHTGILSKCVWSANTTPIDGVQREAAFKYTQYDRAYGLWVPSRIGYGHAAVDWCAAQLGEPFDITSSKSDYSRWYCSKLAWAGWKVRAGVDLDADGGYWVKPADLVNDTQTSTFAYGD